MLIKCLKKTIIYIYIYIYLIEQKIRDDHDSAKKRGQFDNFKKKYTTLKKLYPQSNIIATMWFIDESLIKNKKYYTEQSLFNLDPTIELHILYGGALFTEIFNRNDVWEELTTHLNDNKMERSGELLTIPDFDTSFEIRTALINLKKLSRMSKVELEELGYNTSVKVLFKKLYSDIPEYIQLRKELFPTGQNLNIAKVAEIEC